MLTTNYRPGTRIQLRDAPWHTGSVVRMLPPLWQQIPIAIVRFDDDRENTDLVFVTEIRRTLE